MSTERADVVIVLSILRDASGPWAYDLGIRDSSQLVELWSRTWTFEVRGHFAWDIPGALRRRRTAMLKWFTLREASEFTGISFTSIRRYLDQGRFPRARRDPESGAGERAPWQIPIDDLMRVRNEIPRVPVFNRSGSAHVSPLPDAYESLGRAIAAEAVADERARTIAQLMDLVARLSAKNYSPADESF